VKAPGYMKVETRGLSKDADGRAFVNVDVALKRTRWLYPSFWRLLWKHLHIRVRFGRPR
jgi:hypothetical protein